MLSQSSKDRLGGAILVAMGAAIVFGARSYRMGTLIEMGAGYLPSAIGIGMVAVGLLIVFASAPVRTIKSATSAAPKPPAFEFRAWVCVLGGITAFALVGVYGGFVPASFACVFISALGDRRNSVRDSLLLCLAIVSLGYLLFEVALNIQLSAFSWG